MTNQFWRRLIELERRQLRAARAQTEITNRARAVQQAIQGQSGALTSNFFNGGSTASDTNYPLVSTCKIRLISARVWTTTSFTTTTTWDANYSGSNAWLKPGAGGASSDWLINPWRVNLLNETTLTLQPPYTGVLDINNVRKFTYSTTFTASNGAVVTGQLILSRTEIDALYNSARSISTTLSARGTVSYYELNAISWGAKSFNTGTPLQSGTSGSFLIGPQDLGTTGNPFAFLSSEFYLSGTRVSYFYSPDYFAGPNEVIFLLTW